MSYLNEVAADVVVSSSGKKADFTTIEAAIAALPAAGGSIYIKQGVYPLAVALAPTDKPIKFIGSGRNATILDLGANPIAAFSLAFNNRYTFEDFTIRGTGLVGQRAWNVTAGIVSPKNQQCLRVRTEALETVVNAPAGNLASFEFVCCELELAVIGAGTERIVVAPSGAFIRATDTNMCAETGGGGFTGGSIEVQFLRCFMNVFNGATFGGGGANPFLTNCSIFGISAPGLAIAIGFYRITGNKFTTPFVGVPCLVLSSGGAVVKGNVFSMPVGNTAISVPSSSNIIVGNSNCKVVESGVANSNRYDDNTIFATSTIIGIDSTVEGVRRFDSALGDVTTAVFVDLFTFAQQKAVPCYGTIKNTGGVNSMEVRETGTDAFGVTTSVTSVVVPGGALALVSTFLGLVGVAFPPFVSYTIAVRHPVAATTYEAHFAVLGAVT